MAVVISAMFLEQRAAETAINELHALGYGRDDLSVMMTGGAQAAAAGAGAGTPSAGEGFGVGASIGGVLGAIVAGLTSTGAIIATGGAAAPFVVGPIVAAFAGAGAGGLAGGLAGALVGAGMSQAHAEAFAEGVDRGAILLLVHARDGDQERVRSALSLAGGTLEPAPASHAIARGPTRTGAMSSSSPPAESANRSRPTLVTTEPAQSLNRRNAALGDATPRDEAPREETPREETQGDEAPRDEAMPAETVRGESFPGAPVAPPDERAPIDRASV